LKRKFSAVRNTNEQAVIEALSISELSSTNRFILYDIRKLMKPSKTERGIMASIEILLIQILTNRLLYKLYFKNLAITRINPLARY